jgi:hypothetical protein
MPAFQAPPAFQTAPPFGGVPPAPGPYVHPYAPPTRGGLPGWAIALICAGGGLVMLMIVAAVVIPVFLHQRDAAVAKATTLSPAAQVGGLTQYTDPRMQQVTDQMTVGLSACGCFGPAVTSSYQVPDRTHQLVVIGAKFTRPAGSQVRESFQRGFWNGAHSSMPTLGPASDKDPGRLGGTLRCAPVSSGGAAGQLCASVDAGAVVILVEMDSTGHQPDPDLIVTARESMEHRT